MARNLRKILLCVFIESFVFCSVNGKLLTSLTNVTTQTLSTTTNALGETTGRVLGSTTAILNKTIRNTLYAVDDAVGNALLLIDITSENTPTLLVDGSLKTVRSLLADGSLENTTYLLVHPTLENATYLLVNDTGKNKTDLLVYEDIGDSTYMLLGTLNTTELLLPVKSFTVNRFEDIIDVLDTAGETTETVIGNYSIIVEGVVSIFCPSVTVSFLLYTESNPDEYQVLKLNDYDSLKNSNFNSSRNTTILVHGWLNNGTTPNGFSPIMKNAILKNDNRNVIVVNWTAVTPYTCALAATKPVGKIVAKFLVYLIEEAGVDISSLHIMGHSLGAHISGFGGQYLTTGRLSRISGFDPANPLFDCSNKDNCIDKTDGEFVDVIHSDGGVLGIMEELGDVDFYPNGGIRIQPNCINLELGCSHGSGFLFYAEAISADENGPKFYAAKSNSYTDFKKGICTALNEMGPNVNKTMTGKFYFKTSGVKPYALGYEGIGETCLKAINATSS